MFQNLLFEYYRDKKFDEYRILSKYSFMLLLNNVCRQEGLGVTVLRGQCVRFLKVKAEQGILCAKLIRLTLLE